MTNLADIRRAWAYVVGPGSIGSSQKMEGDKGQHPLCHELVSIQVIVASPLAGTPLASTLAGAPLSHTLEYSNRESCGRVV